MSKKLLMSFVMLAVCACGGKGGGTPTSPPDFNPPPAPPQASSQAIISVGLGSLEGGGVQAATLSVDGREISRGDWSSLSGGCGAGCSLTSVVSGIAPGNHNISMTVTRQSGRSVKYLVLGVVIYSDGKGGGRSIDLPQRTVTLRAGQSVAYSITL